MAYRTGPSGAGHSVPRSDQVHQTGPHEAGSSGSGDVRPRTGFKGFAVNEKIYSSL